MFNIDLDKTLEYKTRDGRLARVKSRVHRSILDHNCDGFFGYIDGIASFWVPGGHVCKGTIEDHPADIIGPWVEPKKEPEVDWSKYPDHFRYLAMDACGRWWAYYHRPKLGSASDVSMWEVTGNDNTLYDGCFRLRSHDGPCFSGSWKDSLCIRPGVEDKKVEPKKPLVDVPWDKLPDWAEVVAMDEDGDWYFYSYIPLPLYNEWSRGAAMVDGDSEFLNEFELPEYPGDWKDSVIIRPGRNPIKDHD